MLQMDEIIPVKSLNEEDIKGLEGHYVSAPGYTVPIYIPEIDSDGTVVFPRNFWKDEEWKNYVYDQHPGENL